MPDLGNGQSESSSASSSTGALFINVSSNSRTINDPINDYSPQQSPISQSALINCSTNIETQQTSLSSLYYSTSEISGNLLNDTTTTSPIYSTDVISSPSSSSYDQVALTSQINNQSPTQQGKIPDIILTGKYF